MKIKISQETNLIDQLIAEQQLLTAVERFAQKHEQSDFHIQSRYYEDLIPLSKPEKGQQYAFAVDLDRCTGCKACVSACHSLNGLEVDETWRDTGLLVGSELDAAYHQTVTTACHHCLEPGCLEGCPVKAYEKDEETGIVRHLDDQCIGCQYCTMKCPYDVPKYSKKLGIVRKCDMCHERLAVGEAPACVQACPHEAITIKIVEVSGTLAQSSPGSQILPGAYDSSYTKPTTRYHSAKPIPANAHAADQMALHLEHAHWPLLIMLVLSQCAVGLSLILAAIPMASSFFAATALPLAGVGFLLLNIGLIAAAFHLGRPLGAWRFFLGLGTSWMSREILAFSVYAGASSAVVGLLLLGNSFVRGFIPVKIMALISLLPISAMTQGAIVVSALLGVVAVFTSAMIYIDTHRSLWRSSQTLPRFYLATLGLGSGAALLLVSLAHQSITLLLGTTLALLTLSTFWELRNLLQARHDAEHPDHLSALTIDRLMPWYQPARVALYAICLLFLLGALPMPVLLIPAFLLQLAGQLLERYAFFSSVIPLRMPRGIS